MDILMVAQYIGNIESIEDNNNRFPYLANLLSSNHDVELVTSNFFHIEKRHFSNIDKEINYKITMLHEPGYSKNICIKRFYSHAILARNMEKYLQNRKKPDIIYSAIPSLSVAKKIAIYCEKNEINFILDIQDLWPEAFKMVFNIPIISDIVFFPMRVKADYIYSKADNIIAVSNTYLERAKKVNNDAEGKIVYLGTDKEVFDKYRNNINNDTNIDSEKINLIYVGTLGASYDLEVVFDALRLLNKEVLNSIEFHIIGDGPKRKYFEEISYGLPVKFSGFISYSKMVLCLLHCDIAINPITKGAAQSIINKHMDYAMAGLPVINTQECKEYIDILNEYKCGINCECANASSVACALSKVVLDGDLRKEMAQNSKNMGETLFDRKKSYPRIVDYIIQKFER